MADPSAYCLKVVEDGKPDRDYHGFRDYDQAALEGRVEGGGPEMVAVVVFDGEPDLWALDPAAPAEGARELVRYYRDEWDELGSRLRMTVYRRHEQVSGSW
ncbi:MAG TPA: hypothetical protein VJ739_03250 [Gemmataceae bacterium]|nr:hypothetical protein [Gemmataceae bacterium]